MSKWNQTMGSKDVAIGNEKELRLMGKRYKGNVWVNEAPAPSDIEVVEVRKRIFAKIGGNWHYPVGMNFPQGFDGDVLFRPEQFPEQEVEWPLVLITVD